MNTEKFAGDTNKRPEGMLQVGAVVQSRYKVLGVLGVERSGLVYLARDLHSPTVQRLLAVKEMLTADPNLRHRSGLLDQFHVEEILDLTADPFLREMALKNFEREANILAELNHPAIPEISDYFSSNDRAYLVRQYINGKDLEAIVNAVPDFLPLNVVRKWAIELCDVLDYLHTYRPPIVFRDIRPSNIMVDQVGKVRLIDFGLAKRFQPNYEGTRYGAEGYSPPEQYRGEASPASDQYALGATLHHILTRRDPRHEPPFSFMERPIRQTNPAVSAEFEAVVMRALNYEPAWRFPSARAMRDAMEHIR